MNKYEDYIEKLVTISESIKKDKITILTGKNAGGKSLIRKVVTGDVRKTPGSKVYHASQELRTKSQPEMGALSSMAHDLEWLATSDNTLHTIEQVFRKDATYIIIDEPEIGCGEELQLGLVDFINRKIEEFKPQGVLIITHSRIIVKGVKHDDFVNLEDMTEKEWVKRKPIKRDVKEFKTFASELHNAIRDRINRNEAAAKNNK